MVGPPQSATVVITTRNRKGDLRNAVASAIAQIGKVEIVVIDDGSSDGTSEMIRSEFPQVRLVRHLDSRGLVVRRNEGARLATGEVIFSIDDDAEFTSPRTVQQTLREFDDPRIGAVAIPYVEPRKNNRVQQRAPVADAIWVTDCYIGTSHAVRRDLFLRLGGYRERLVHQGEEKDFCIRVLRAGRVVRLGRADVIHHYESPDRDTRRMDFFGRRNDLYFAWHYVPLLFLPLHLAATTLNGCVSVLRSRRPAQMLLGMLSGFAGGLREWGERSPVPVAVYLLHRRLKKSGPCRLDDIEPLLPSASGAEAA